MAQIQRDRSVFYVWVLPWLSRGKHTRAPAEHYHMLAAAQSKAEMQKCHAGASTYLTHLELKKKMHHRCYHLAVRDHWFHHHHQHHCLFAENVIASRDKRVQDTNAIVEDKGLNPRNPAIWGTKMIP